MIKNCIKRIQKYNLFLPIKQHVSILWKRVLINGGGITAGDTECKRSNVHVLCVNHLDHCPLPQPHTLPTEHVSSTVLVLLPPRDGPRPVDVEVGAQGGVEDHPAEVDVSVVLELR